MYAGVCMCIFMYVHTCVYMYAGTELGLEHMVHWSWYKGAAKNVNIYMCVYVYMCMYVCMYVHPIPPVVTFLKARSKARCQSS